MDAESATLHVSLCEQKVSRATFSHASALCYFFFEIVFPYICDTGSKSRKTIAYGWTTAALVPDFCFLKKNNNLRFDFQQQHCPFSHSI